MTRLASRTIVSLLLPFSFIACVHAQPTPPDPLNGAKVHVETGQGERVYTLLADAPATQPTTAAAGPSSNPVGPTSATDYPTSAPVSPPTTVAITPPATTAPAVASLPPGSSTTQTSTSQPALPLPVTPSAPAPNFDVMLTAGMAPATIHVRATAADLASPDALISRYQWTFDDSNGSFTTLVGFNAAHLFRRPGTYTIRLTRTNPDGSVGVAEKRMTIAPDTRPRTFVSSNGNDTHDGLTEATAVRTFARGVFLVRDNCMLLFRRGDIFDVASTGVIRSDNVVIDAFGPPAAPLPVLRVTQASLRDTFQTASTSSDVVIQNLSFDSITPNGLEKSAAARAFAPAGVNMTLADCTLLNVSDGVNADRQPRGLLVQNCVAPTPTSLRGYLTWAAGSDVVILGNRALNSTREHIVRVSRCERVLISGNDLQNQRRVSLGDPSDIAKGVITLQQGSMYYVTQNTVRGGALSAGPLGGRDGVKGASARTQRVVIDANRLINSGVEISAGAESVVARNNMIRRDEYIAFAISGSDATTDAAGALVYAARKARDIHIVHNTMIAAGKGPTFLRLNGAVEAGEISLQNNLMIAPNLATGYDQHAAVYVEKPDLTCFKTIRENVWPIPASTNGIDQAVMYISPRWKDVAGYFSPQRWSAQSVVAEDRFDAIPVVDGDTLPTSRATLISTRRPPGAFVDLAGQLRPATRCTAGAIEAQQ